MPTNYVKNVEGQTWLVREKTSLPGAQPVVYKNVAMINTSSNFSISANSESAEIVDLNDVEAAAQTVRSVRSTDFKLEGSGLVHAPEVMAWVQSSMLGEKKTFRLELNKPAADGGFSIEGSFVISNFSITAERKKSSECQISLEQGGALVVAAASA